MAFNLVREAWVPVRRASGVSRIPPWRLTEGLGEDPVLELAFPRPDLGAATLEWLIGLVQTCYWPDLKNDADWHRVWRSPPSPEELRERMEEFVDYFELFNEGGPAFMQDLRPGELDKTANVDKLLFEVAGQKAAWFVKEGGTPSLCPSCAAAALHMLQTYAPSGGAGVRTGLRGGGPLSTIIVKGTLWQTVWANVLPQGTLGKLGDMDAPLEFGVFPWMAETRISSKGSLPIHADQVHPLHQYWAMPRRMRLVAKQGGEACACCACAEGPRVTGFSSRHHGNNYEGAWNHPLSAIRHDPKAGPISVKGKAYSGYRDWLGLVFQETEEKKAKKGEAAQTLVTREPAPVIYRAGASPRRRSALTPFGLRACGFDMDNMKVLAWVDETLPLLLAEDPETLARQQRLAEQLVKCAVSVRQSLYAAVRIALFDERKDRNSGTTTEEIDAEFWMRSQPHFNAAMAAWLQSSDRRTEGVRRDYLRGLQQVAETIFNTCAASAALDDTQWERQARGWRLLLQRTSWKKAEVWTILDIAPPERAENPVPMGEQDAHSTV